MKVYVVTAGEYSSYHIEAIFTNEDIARQYANLNSDRCVEEYETDIESIEYDSNKLIYSVTYDIEENRIKTLYLTSIQNAEADSISEFTSSEFYFNVGQSESLDWDIRMFGMQSDTLLKIAQDRFYMYCDKHETSRQELIQKKHDYYKKYEDIYPMYTTSLTTEQILDKAACTKVNDILHELIAEGNTPPSYGDLVGIMLQARKDAEKKHEQDELH